MKAKVIIIMGSKTDSIFADKIAEAAKGLGLEVIQRIGSAHKTAGHLIQMIQAYESDPTPKVYITVAGRSNALSGFVDGLVSAPVIACPPASEAFGGVDIYSSLRMPSGIAACVVLEPINAALLAGKILGLVDPEVQGAVREYQARMAQTIVDDDAKLFTGNSAHEQ